MYILHHLNYFIMIYTFKTRKSLLNHFRALAQLASTIYDSKLPLSDFECYIPRIISLLPWLRKGYCKGLYFAIREHGFEFEDNSFLFNSSLDGYKDVKQSYVLTYFGGKYLLSPYPQE